MYIEHINISAPRVLLEQLRDFYCFVFKLTEGFRPASPIRGCWLYADNRALIHLAESDEHFASERQGYLDHIAFQTTGLSEIVERIEVLGLSYSSDHFAEIGMTQLFFKDPAGTGLEINFLHESL